MKPLRLSYASLSPEAYQGLVSVKKALEKSSLGNNLTELVYLRVSQINGCSFCLEMHSKSLREGGEKQSRLDAVAGWHVSTHFTPRERAALQWAESLCNVADTHAPDSDYDSLKAHFTDNEISDLTFAVALMNAFNRLAIGMRQ